MFRKTALVLALGLCCHTVAHAKDMKVKLDYAPQENVGSQSAVLSADVLDRPVKLAVESRLPAGDRIGTGTDDDDKPFAILADGSPLAFLQTVAGEVLRESGGKVDEAAPLVLNLQLLRFNAEESNKPVGSMYHAVVNLGYELRKGGQRLYAGTTSGDASRYGGSASPENTAEVLSDATKEAVAAALSDAKLQAAWTSGRPQAGGAVAASAGVAPAPATESPEARLEKLDKLLRAGKITPAEHKAARAKVLESL